MTAPVSAARPPAHVTEHLANERTFLAWSRTSIALITLGFVVAKFSVWLRQFLATVAAQHTAVLGPGGGTPPVVGLPAHSGASLPAGLALMGLSAVVAVAALARHQAVARAIERGEFLPARGLVVVLTAAVVLATAAIIVYLSTTASHL